jgi:hypothetical protein
MKQILMLVMLFGVLSATFGHAEAATATLTWAEPAPDATHGSPAEFDVYRSTDAVACAAVSTPLLDPPLATLPATALTYVDNAVPNVNGTVCYEVQAKNAGGVARSNRVSKSTTVNPPFAPTLAIQ